MGGLMGGSSSSSDSASQQESVARQAMFYATPEAIYESSRVLQGALDRANAPLRPFQETGEQALDQIRFLQGMAPLDPTVSMRGDLDALMSGLVAPRSAAVDDQGHFMMSQLQLDGTRPPIGAEGPTFTQVLEGAIVADQERGEPLPSYYPGGFFDGSGPAQQGVVSGGPKGFSGSAFADMAQYPERFKPTTIQERLQPYTFSAETMTNYVQAPMEQVSNAFTKLATEVDPEERQRLYDTAISGFQDTSTKIGHVMAGNIDGDVRVSGLQDTRQKLNDMRAEFEQRFTREAGQAPTSDEIYDRVSSSPGYQTRYRQGEEALENSAVARGLMNSGRFAKELSEYGQEFASREYQQQLANMYQLAGLGQPALQQTSAQIQQTGPAQSQAVQDASRIWNMSPWTNRSFAKSASHSESKSSGGIGGILGSVVGGLFG